MIVLAGISLITVYITCPSNEVAQTIANTLLEDRLIACANIMPVTSIYRWKGNIETSQEYVVLGKTVQEKYEAICAKVAKIHPYEVPCIEMFEATANASFAEWVAKEVA
jgi:periplasmic divalent cation tolerance protein